MAPTPKIDAVRRRNCAMRYNTESWISPDGGTTNPAIPKPMAARKEVTATAVCIFVIVFTANR